MTTNSMYKNDTETKVTNMHGRLESLVSYLISHKNFTLTQELYTKKQYFALLYYSYNLGTTYNGSHKSRYSYEKLLFITLFRDYLDDTTSTHWNSIILPDSIEALVVTITESYQIGCRHSTLMQNLNLVLFGRETLSVQNSAIEENLTQPISLYCYHHKITHEIHNNLRILFKSIKDIQIKSTST